MRPGSSSMPSSSARWTRRTCWSSTRASAERWSRSRQVARATSASTYGGSPGWTVGRSADVLVHVLVGDLDGGLTGVRLLAGEHLVEHGAAGVDVGAGVGALVDDDLGREVGDGADQRAAGGGRGRADGAGQAEVGDLDVAVGCDQHVLGLDVAVDEVRPRGRRTGRRAPGPGARAPRVGRHRRLVAHEVAQGAAGHVLHDEVGDLAVRALVEDRHDVRGGSAGPRPGPRARSAG